MATKKKQGFVQQFNNLQKLVRATAAVRLPEVAVLSEEERARTLRARADFEVEAPLIASLAAEAKLDLPGFDLEQMHADLEFVGQLGSTRKLLGETYDWWLRLLDDTILSRRARAWETFLAYYATLVKLSAKDAAIEEKLKPVVDFLSHDKVKRKVVNEDKEPTPEPVPVKVKEANG